jgi:hypothetical protein
MYDFIFYVHRNKTAEFVKAQRFVAPDAKAAWDMLESSYSPSQFYVTRMCHNMFNTSANLLEN